MCSIVYDLHLVCLSSSYCLWCVCSECGGSGANIPSACVHLFFFVFYFVPLYIYFPDWKWFFLLSHFAWPVNVEPANNWILHFCYYVIHSKFWIHGLNMLNTECDCDCECECDCMLKWYYIGVSGRLPR